MSSHKRFKYLKLISVHSKLVCQAFHCHTLSSKFIKQYTLQPLQL